MASWTLEEVGVWIESLGFPQYKSCFTENFIDGKKLRFVDASSLPSMGITDWQHIQTIAKAVREAHSPALETPKWDKSITEIAWRPIRS